MITIRYTDNPALGKLWILQSQLDAYNKKHGTDIKLEQVADVESFQRAAFDIETRNKCFEFVGQPQSYWQ